MELENDSSVKFCIDFVPEQDITTYELALAVRFLTTITAYKNFKAEYYQGLFDKLDENVKRHFVTEIK